MLQRDLTRVDADDVRGDLARGVRPGTLPCELIGRLRPELDVYLVTDRSVEEIAGRDLGDCRRVFYNQEDFMELHLNILRGVQARYETPFFTALKEYTRQPTGVFHAMPISRGKSITSSHWIQDMGEFYGLNIFLAETSATSGGLDSLLEPTGPIKKAQELAARAFGAQQTFFVTNGTSTANKIVVQALVQPGDIVLVDRDCHKSHHYGMVLAGAHVVYLDSYPLHRVLDVRRGAAARDQAPAAASCKAAGKLDRVQDAAAHQLHLRRHRLQRRAGDGGVPGDQARPGLPVGRGLVRLRPLRPDLPPAHRRCTARSGCANAIASPKYRERLRRAASRRRRGLTTRSCWTQRLLPDPDKARVRVYATQSTHKTLTSLRQGSMIHVYDQDFKGEVEQAFHEAYMTHTSTSPNYQILASLDVGRRQVELEGFELVQKQVELAMALREAIDNAPAAAASTSRCSTVERHDPARVPRVRHRVLLRRRDTAGPTSGRPGPQRRVRARPDPHHARRSAGTGLRRRHVQERRT